MLIEIIRDALIQTLCGSTWMRDLTVGKSDEQKAEQDYQDLGKRAKKRNGCFVDVMAHSDCQL